MAATTTSSTVTATPSVDTSNLARGLFTDLGPLLALFGDEVTKQFLTTSLGFGDDLLLAIAPIGIMTIIVSAIRVGGYPWMKSLIGRARDSPDDEEKEVLSSTSSSVREIWNGYRIIRQTGESQTFELVLQDGVDCANGLDDPLLHRLQDGLENGHWVMESVKERHQWSLSRLLSRLVRRNRHEKEKKGSDDIDLMTVWMRNKAPNLTINIPNAITDPMYLWIWVAVGVTLQCLVLFFNAYVVYHKHWLRAGARVASYGFLLWASGTLSVIIGLSMCGYVIENVTTEYIVTHGKPESRIVRFQKALPSMNLPAYAFLHRDSQVLVSIRTIFQGRTSTFDHNENWQDITTDLFLRKKGRLAFTTLLGTGLALAGFILQNLGTRELHFSASIAQLIVTLALTVIRSWVRRNVGIPAPDCKALRRGGEAIHMIYEMCGIRRLTVNAECSVLAAPQSSIMGTQLLHIAPGTTPFNFIDENETAYRRYALKLLQG